jgi:hypothetical protein
MGASIAGSLKAVELIFSIRSPLNQQLYVLRKTSTTLSREQLLEQGLDEIHNEFGADVSVTVVE